MGVDHNLSPEPGGLWLRAGCERGPSFFRPMYSPTFRKAKSVSSPLFLHSPPSAALLPHICQVTCSMPWHSHTCSARSPTLHLPFPPHRPCAQSPIHTSRLNDSRPWQHAGRPVLPSPSPPESSLQPLPSLPSAALPPRGPSPQKCLFSAMHTPSSTPALSCSVTCSRPWPHSLTSSRRLPLPCPPHSPPHTCSVTCSRPLHDTQTPPALHLPPLLTDPVHSPHHLSAARRAAGPGRTKCWPNFPSSPQASLHNVLSFPHSAGLPSHTPAASLEAGPGRTQSWPLPAAPGGTQAEAPGHARPVRDPPRQRPPGPAGVGKVWGRCEIGVRRSSSSARRCAGLLVIAFQDLQVWCRCGGGVRNV